MPATASPSTMSRAVAAIPQLAELNIGHFLVGEAIFTGFEASVARMRALMDEARDANPPRDGEGDQRAALAEGALRPARRVRRAPTTTPLRARCPLPVPGRIVMIIGLGSDLCNIERIQRSLDRFGERFINRVFTETERAKAERRPFTRAGTYAKRFAAKEAFSKAVGTGFKRGVFMKDIGVVNLPSGQPTLALTGGAKERLDAMTPPGHAATVHLTMTDDHPFAMAVVIIEAVPQEPQT